MDISSLTSIWFHKLEEEKAFITSLNFLFHSTGEESVKLIPHKSNLKIAHEPTNL